MLNNHPTYSLFQQINEQGNSKFYKLDHIKIQLTEIRKIKTVSVTTERKEVLIQSLLYKDDQELEFILDRVAPIRLVVQRYISLPQILEVFGQS